jgi:hypothetical protein
MRNPRQRSEDNQIGMWDNATDHAECFAGCEQNPENPYDPNGPGSATHSAGSRCAGGRFRRCGCSTEKE